MITLLCLLFMSACALNSSSAEFADVVEAAVVDERVNEPALAAVTPTSPVPTVAPSPLPLPAVVVNSEPTAGVEPPPAFALPDADDLATATPLPTATNRPEPTVTPTPIPTFTPPSLPGTSANEHYWFWRPVPEGGTVWTDKTYPYASTRGGTLQVHHGVEFWVPGGTSILASAAGTVVVAGDDANTAFGPKTNFYGNLIVIEHEARYKNQPVYTLYAHLSQVGVVVGQQVKALQPIALSGATGIAEGAHLHFEVRVGANNYESTRNPVLWLYPFSTHGSIAGRLVRPNGSLVEEAALTISRIDASSRYRSTTSYADGQINGDNGWRENFVFDDVEAGYYKVFVRVGVKKYEVETWVYPLLTSFVEIEIDDFGE